MKNNQQSVYHYLFGPVPSRRLGRSLGIDLVPPKTCPLNCVYCEAGRTTVLTRERQEYVPTEAVLQELDQFLSTNPGLDYVTFSGAGEPTLHRDLGKIVAHIKSRWPQYHTALLTNGLCMSDPVVRQEALPFDVVLPSLDAGTEAVFQRINRPIEGYRLQELVEALVAFRNEYKGLIWLEVFLLPGINDEPEEIEAIIEHVRRIRPDEVHLNTLDRPGTESGLVPPPFSRLERIAERFAPIVAKPISRKPEKMTANTLEIPLEHLILSAVQRRPCTLDDLVLMTGMPAHLLKNCLSDLLKSEQLATENGPRGEFYRIR